MLYANGYPVGGGSGSTEIIADDFDATSTYAVGDYCIYDGKLYKCTTAVSTAGDWDSSDWTETIVMDEVGGGGDTGGHTIIDENGASMTARAGLQFVGGANVSDDSTNNKTIVDLASAGGIDGVFVDVENVIQETTEVPTSSDTEYVATEDCCVGYILYGGASSAGIWIDGTLIGAFPITQRDCIFVKKGQTVKFRSPQSTGTYTVYGIQTGTTHSKFQPVIYSTEEREIGVWTDGKPLYEKTVYIASLPSTTTQTNYAHNINNIDKIINYEGTIQFNNATKTTAKFDRIGTSTNILDFGNTLAMTITNENIAIIVGKDRSVCSAYVTVRYTKSTDTAGSGSWTPQGVPSHHYSTDEHIVGTWIDGKTLYEKTVSFTTGSAGAYNTYDTGILNPDTIMFDFNASYYETSNAKVQALSYWGEIPSSGYSNAFCILANKVDNKIRIDYRVGNTASDKTAYVTVRYTKSS